MADIKITLKRSLIGRPQKQHNAIKSLGLTKKIGSHNIVRDNETNRNTIQTVQHLLEIEEVSE